MNAEQIIQTIRDAAPQRSDPLVSGPYRHLVGLIEAHVIGQPYFDQHPPHTLTPTQWTLLRIGVASIREGRAAVALREAADRLAAALQPVAVEPIGMSEQPTFIPDEADEDGDTVELEAHRAPDPVILPPEQPGTDKQERAGLPPAPVEPRFAPRPAHSRPAAGYAGSERVQPAAHADQDAPLPHDDSPSMIVQPEPPASAPQDADEPRAILYDLCLSYDDHDLRLGERLERHLRQQGFQIISDRLSQLGSTSLEAAIRASLLLAVVQTPAAARSASVQRALDYARRWHVPVLALLAGDEKRAVLAGAEAVPRLDIRGSRYDAGVRALLRELRRRRARLPDSGR
ncbi:MAG: hypothetical protein ACUVS2_07000 [Candidatus Flexifilum sp.]|jgi:hypothetical protein